MSAALAPGPYDAVNNGLEPSWVPSVTSSSSSGKSLPTVSWEAFIL